MTPEQRTYLVGLKQKMDAAALDPFITTPAEIAPHVIYFCNKRLKGGTPIWVPVVQEPNAPLDECFNVVDRRIKRDGGSRENGWLLGEWPKIMIEAVFHAVWINPEGQRVDISPKKLGEKRSMFVPDPAMVFDKKNRIDNRREPLRDHKLVKEYIALAINAIRLMGPGIGIYKPSKEMVANDIRRAEVELALREMTSRALIEAARIAAQTAV